jgi:hypothetical protein
VAVAAADLDGRRGTIGNVAIHGAVAVVHGAYKLARSALLAAALALALRAAPMTVHGVAGLMRGGVVAWLRTRPGALLEEFLLLPALTLALALSLMVRRLLLGGRRRCCLGHGGRRRLAGWLLCLALWRVLLAAFILAAAPTAPMPLRLPLAISRSRPQISLGLRRFCHHAFTSWQSAV